MPRAVWWSRGGGRVLVSEVPLYMPSISFATSVHAVGVPVAVVLLFSSLLPSSLELSDTQVYES